MNYHRILELKEGLSRKSVFLFGPRQTGKSTFLKYNYPQAPFYNLNQADNFRELSSAPELIRQRLTDKDEIVIIDEIQKLPKLLDEVQAMIDTNPKVRFILTGSSARKLKRGSANLLGGRARTYNMHPLVSPEVDFKKLNQRIIHGSLPSILDTPEPFEDLKDYVGSYLREEIQAEGLVRSIEAFSKFIDFAAFSNGEQVNFTKVGNDSGIPPRTVREYFYILQDTLIGNLVEPFQKTKKRKAVSTAKFYFFDNGVANYLLKRPNIIEGSQEFGKSMEHLIFLELRAFLDYHRLDHPLCYWRTHSQFEVDFVIGSEVAIEVKSSAFIHNRDMRGMRALSEDVKLRRKIIVCKEKVPRKTDDKIEILPIEHFLHELWSGSIITR